MWAIAFLAIQPSTAAVWVTAADCDDARIGGLPRRVVPRGPEPLRGSCLRRIGVVGGRVPMLVGTGSGCEDRKRELERR